MDRASVAPSEADSVGTGISAQNNRKVFLGKGGVAGHLTRPHANSSQVEPDEEEEEEDEDS